MYLNILRLWDNHEKFWNLVVCILLPGRLMKCCITRDLLTFTLASKKNNFHSCWRNQIQSRWLAVQYTDVLWLCKDGGECWNGVFGKFYQEYWELSKVHWTTLLPKRKATSDKLRFFWGRLYIPHGKLKYVTVGCTLSHCSWVFGVHHYTFPVPVMSSCCKRDKMNHNMQNDVCRTRGCVTTIIKFYWYFFPPQSFKHYDIILL